MSGIKLVVFDIAGTIIEDHGEILRAFRTAADGERDSIRGSQPFSLAGYPPKLRNYGSSIAFPLVQLLDALL